MKLHPVVAATLALVSVAASAQSTVTLFGVADVNIRNVKNSGTNSNITMSDDGLSSGRFGFRGIEELGAGMKAGFWLESDVNVDSGTTSTKFFNRRSTASLISNWGELRLGRDLTPSGAHTYLYDPFGVIGVGGSTGVARFAGQTTFYRSDNAVQYFTPNLGGFQGQLMWAPDESAVDNVNRYAGARLSYAAGPFSVSGSYGSTDVVGGKFKTIGIAGSYDLGMAKLMAHYYRDKLVAAQENRLLLGVSLPLGPHEIRASYIRSDAVNGTAAYNNSDASKFAVGYVHNLSRRTALYTTFARISNKGGATFAIAGGAPGITPGGKSTGYELGVRHSF